MTGRHHLVSGAVAGICIASSALLSEQHHILIVGGAIIATMAGSLFPDIDTSTSKLGSKIKLASKIIGKLFGHRGFLHSPLFAVCIWLLCRHLFNKHGIAEYSLLYQAFALGMINHLFCDMMTKGGVPLFYPFYKFKMSFTNLKSGSKWEILTLGITCAFCIMITILFVVAGTFI